MCTIIVFVFFFFKFSISQWIENVESSTQTHNAQHHRMLVIIKSNESDDISALASRITKLYRSNLVPFAQLLLYELKATMSVDCAVAKNTQWPLLVVCSNSCDSFGLFTTDTHQIIYCDANIIAPNHIFKYTHTQSMFI